MNSSVKVSDLQRWQQCIGMCLICGQPVGLSESSINWYARQASEAGHDTPAVGEDIDEKGEGVNTEESMMERMSLSEECPVRLCMMRFRLLGKREECHIVDSYTHLERGSSETRFNTVFNKKSAAIIKLGPAYASFSETVITAASSDVLNTALATCKRVAKPLTFSGCRACNIAMEKSSAHANAIYRCFPLTAKLNVKELEENTQESIKIKKILEQVALYFKWVPTTTAAKEEAEEDEKGHWEAKSDERIVRDTCIWRCVAHLYCWGRNNKFRSRLVAIFHAANYMFERSTFKGFVTFDDWHAHIFQPYYMLHYDATTWFGLSQTGAAAMFDFAEQHGKRWMAFVHRNLDELALPSLEKWAEKEVKISSILTFKDNFIRSVTNERQLVRFVAHKLGPDAGIEKLYAYYLFNISGKQDYAILEHAKRFIKELGKTFKQLK